MSHDRQAYSVKVRISDLKVLFKINQILLSQPDAHFVWWFVSFTCMSSIFFKLILKHHQMKESWFSHPNAEHLVKKQSPCLTWPWQAGLELTTSWLQSELSTNELPQPVIFITYSSKYQHVHSMWTKEKKKEWRSNYCYIAFKKKKSPLNFLICPLPILQFHQFWIRALLHL